MSSTAHPRSSRARLIARPTLSTSLALLLTLLALCISPLRAEASELEAINSVQITEPDGQLHLGDSIRLEATWAVPDDAQPGDTFWLGLPTEPRVVGFSDTFDLEDTNGHVVGTCTVDETQIMCTLGDYVTTHVDVSGTLFFWARVTEVTSAETLVFSTGAEATIQADIPGGVIEPAGGDNWRPPAHPIKSGEYDRTDGNMRWHVYVPGDYLTYHGGDPVVLTDTFDPRLTLVEDSITLYVAAASSEDFFHSGTWLDSSAYVIETGPDNNQFRFSVPEALGADHVYLLSYATSLPADAHNGDLYENTVTGIPCGDVVAQAEYAGAGGSGGGKNTRVIRLTKRVDGSAAQDVTGQFEFTLRCADQRGTPLAGFPRTVEVPVNGTANFGQVPVGAVCDLDETDGDAYRVSFVPGARLEVTESSPATIDVVATNTFDARTGALTVTKRVTGPAADLVPEATRFTVDYMYDGADGVVTGKMTVADGESVTLADVPAGTVVTLVEAEPGPVAGAIWSEPLFTGDGVEQTSDKAAHVVVGDDTTVQVVLTNPVGAAAPPLAPGTSGGTHSGPALSPTTLGGLATTGSPAATAALIAGLLVVAGGAATLAQRGRARNRPRPPAHKASSTDPSTVSAE